MNINKVLLVVTALLWTAAMQAQDKIVYPEITYAGTPRTVTIGGINVSGVDNYEDYVLTGISGLTVGQEIDIPGSQITDAVNVLEQYAKLARQGVRGENAASIRAEVERNAASIATAFENQLDALYAAESMDLSADLTVLQNMLKGQGLG